MAVRKKTQKKRAQHKLESGHIILILIALITVLGSGVLFFLWYQQDIDYQAYQQLAQENEYYLLENQGQIMQEIHEDQVDPQRLGHVFIPEYPATYIDIQDIPQHNVPYINQNDPAWRDLSYGTDGSQKMWENGCAIAVLAMVDQYYTGSNTSVKEIIDWAGDDYYIHGQGSTWQIYPAFGQAFGYEVINYERDFYAAMEALDQGYLVIVSVGPGTFTLGGHVMLIRGFDDGLVYLNDPNDSPANMFSIRGIPAQTMIDDALNYWAIAR